MPSSATILIVAIFLAVDAVVLLAIRAWAKMTFAELAAAFPPVDPSPGAVTRRYQGISVDNLNFGFCFIVTVDEHGVHFAPMRLARAFGARGFSVPWDAVNMQGRRRGRWMQKARIGKWEITGPAWALKLAEGSAS